MRNGLIAALDVGSTKVCCFLARVQDDGMPRIVGIGHQVARGMRAGAVVDLEELEHSIRAAVDAAEDMANERVRAVVVNLSGGAPGSTNVKVEVSMNGHAVNEADIRRMLDHGRAHHENAERDLIHAIPVDYTIDGNEGIRDPRGMYGERLGVAIHVISAATGPVRNLMTVVHRCHLDIEARVVSPFAAGLACLVDDEKELGVTCIDMGGGTTSIAVFVAGQLVHTDVIPVGGHHVTNDIARGLSTPLSYAERMKTLYGSAIPSPSDDREMLKVPLVGEDEDGASNQVPRSMLIQIIQPRLEETLELVRSHLEKSGFDKMAGRRVVLTGGASQMQGVRDLAGLVLDKQVRLGRPVGLHGLPESTNGPAFSTCAGLIRYAMAHQPVAKSGRKAIQEQESPGGWGRIGSWLKRNF
ncbi:Cell division protein FtsA [Magnetospirillum gryphiswaldense MSR-1]|uniref:Cell division protein FtsA n=2 Tax=Magnetospirillum gryphiswaldense TaxID=55518 RepID=V6F2T7_MAGGM|nr:Cell division protein FtsA [Magnetospirillum gryphiswaldense MSR-1]AVM80172.1 Cell division protein FtsA [Magnetospirillum gryphiswaldense]CDK99717.1 cell division protein with ATPase domain, involved in recruitment of FtsK to Z ring [Magnetospirillum gryphiswaldense MSR-1 v2]